MGRREEIDSGAEGGAGHSGLNSISGAFRCCTAPRYTTHCTIYRLPSRMTPIDEQVRARHEARSVTDEIQDGAPELVRRSETLQHASS